MSTYSYRAVDNAGELHEGVAAADSEEQLAERLGARGLILLEADEGSSAAAERGKPKPRRRLQLRGRRKVGREEIGIITRELAALTRAGLPLDRAMEIMVNIAESDTVRELIGDVRERVRGGASLAEALEAHEGVFGRFYVNMIHAGEVGGATDVALARLSEYLERAKALRETIVSALIYPIILFGVAVISVVVLLMFVVPQFEQLFSDMGKALPLPTRIVMGTGDWLQAYWWLLAGLIGLAVFGFRRLLEQPRWRAGFDRFSLRAPVFGELIGRAETARFARTLGTLLDNGVSMLNALQVVAGTLSNRVLVASVERAMDGMRSGSGLADALEEDGQFPALAVNLVRVGEETGRLEEMLGQIAEVYDEEVRASVKRMLALVEPVLILGLGVIIAGIIMSILVAILGVNELAF